MSRFYEALKQASQAAGRPDADPTAPDFSEVLAPDDSPDAPFTADLPAEPPESLTGASKNGSLGTLSDVVVNRKARVMPNAVDPMLVEQYRQLRTRILFQREQTPFRSVLVTSANSKEGKTLTALNLAWTFSMLPSFRVLAVDGDLRRGHLSHWLRIQDKPGLANLLEGTASLNEVVLKSSAIPFHVMALGHSKLSPPELVHSSRWPNQSREISQHFDLVIVDSAPVSLVADAQLLAAGCDTVLLVARAFRTSRDAFEKLRREFQRFRVLGMVLNGSEDGGSRDYKHYYSQKS
jgi:capsular exopolysaccharide synthesis family protein